jgi:hypothetical protein
MLEGRFRHQASLGSAHDVVWLDSVTKGCRSGFTCRPEPEARDFNGYGNSGDTLRAER